MPVPSTIPPPGLAGLCRVQHGARIQITTRSGHIRSGVIEMAGEDYIGVRSHTRTLHLIPYCAVDIIEMPDA